MKNLSEEILETITHSALETIEYARKFAKSLKGGEIIGLIGDLGGGKTTFTKGLAEGLGVKESITSPTFVILKEYAFSQAILRPKPHLPGEENRLKKFVHIDAYRAETLDDIKSVGIEDFIGRNDVVIVVEWAEKIKELLPKSTIYIGFEAEGENDRKISIK